MKKRVFGVLGIVSIMANWNADFSGYPKTTSKGQVFGSDKAFKYPMKKLWDEQGEKVLYIKSMTPLKEKNGTLSYIPRTLNERYKQLFGEDDFKDAQKVLCNLFSAVDVKNFGATFAEKSTNISITGAVQFGQGFNKYDRTMPQEQQILSPFRIQGGAGKNEEKDKEKDKEKDEETEAKNSTLGTKIVSDEAHYFYPFSINPRAYKEYVEYGVTDGYTEENYEQFKQTALGAATAFSTNAKAGCENEFALFVETKEDVYLPNLSEYIVFEKAKAERGKNVIHVNCGELLNSLRERIDNIQIYYNPYSTDIQTDIAEADYYNIFTKEPCRAAD